MSRSAPPGLRKALRLSCMTLSTLCLCGSFAQPLTAIEVWRFRNYRYAPPQILAFHGDRPRYADNPKVEILAFLPAGDQVAPCKCALLLLACGFAGYAIALTRLEKQSTALLDRLSARWVLLDDAGRRKLKAEVDELAAFMAYLSGEPENAAMTTPLERPAVPASHRISGEAPHVTSDRLRQAAALLGDGMDEAQAVARAWQIESGTPEHGERLVAFRRWLED